MKHKIASDSNNPDHPRPVFHATLLQRWKEHFAAAFPSLESSKAINKQVGAGVWTNAHSKVWSNLKHLGPVWELCPLSAVCRVVRWQHMELLRLLKGSPLGHNAGV